MEPEIKYSFINFWHGMNENDYCFNLLQNIFNETKLTKNYNESDIIISGCFIYENERFQQVNTRNFLKSMLFITEPIEKFPLIETLVLNNKFDVIFGSVENNIEKKFIKFPFYYLYLIDKDISFFTTIKVEDKSFFQKSKFCALVQNYTVCTSVLNSLNELSPIELVDVNKKNNNYKFFLCDNKTFKYDSFAMSSLFDHILFGSIPIYSGYFDEIDENIFNKNRILFYNKENIKSLQIKIKDLISDPDKFINFYNQPIFSPNAFLTLKNQTNLLANKFHSLVKPLKKMYLNLFFKHNKLLCNKDFAPTVKINLKEENNCVVEKIPNNNKDFIDFSDIKSTAWNFNCEEIDDFTKILKPTFTLIIDFNNLGGGSTFFLNSIISKYKKDTQFLIVRPKSLNSNKLNVYVNEDCICKSITEIDFVSFAYVNESRINKIFINHLLGHNLNFIKNILNLKKESIYITHDFYMINNFPQPLFNNINFDRLNDEVNINSFSSVIIQNKILYQTLKQFITVPKVYLEELPDFKNTKNVVFSSNDKIIIAVIGGVSDIKGKSIIHELIEFIKINNLNMEVVVIGHLNDYEKVFPYSSIQEFNNLLSILHPNVIVEASIWMETYSYTLTMSMITDLPILSLEKPYDSVVKNRLKSYDKAYYFSSMNDLIILIEKYSQNYFFTLDSKIYFDNFWKDLFV
jgi:hypothetical protein